MIFLYSSIQRFQSIWVSALILAMPIANVIAATYNSGDFNATPIVVTDGGPPLVMLALSNDHQLFYKAFTDWDNLDGDVEGIIETTYTHEFDYEGYFDGYKCYSYNNSLFSPDYATDDKYCKSASGWSGNFLNWVTMTRMDEVRKVLYGGKRVVDTNSSTVLERALLPNDAHSYTKYYNGTDLPLLTPFSNNVVPTGIENKEDSGLTICNTTMPSNYSSGTVNSSTLNDPPLMRVVKGNYQLWAANERFQCRFKGQGLSGSRGKNQNDSAITGIYAYNDSPETSAKVGDGDYVVRVEVCKTEALIGNENCKKYPNGSYKPIGILQEFGDDGAVKFGLMSGSYKKNKSGGVLRKNIANLEDEVNSGTFSDDREITSTNSDGTFTNEPGIIQTIDAFRIANYDYVQGYYNDLDSCKWGINSFDNGSCTNWGNPFSEIMLECYRYFAGATASSGFDANDSSILSGLIAATWSDPLNADNACANLSVIAFNTSSSSYDSDELNGVSDLNTASTAEELTKLVGNGYGADDPERITGGSYFVGESGGAAVNDNDQLCTAKTISNLGVVQGSCPDAPRLEGSYGMAGIAHHVNMNDIRNDTSSNGLDGLQTVSTYGVSLSPSLPTVNIPVPGSVDRTVTILPACRNGGNSTNCGLVDFKIVKNYVETSVAGVYEGSFYVNWEDSEQGGDYDQDMSGVLKYEISSNSLSITTDVFSQSTGNEMGFGYVLNGVSPLVDGFQVHSGSNSFSYSSTNGALCVDCETGDGPSTKSYSIAISTSANLLEPPLYYASKWGGFTDTDGDGLPNLDVEWDNTNNSTGAKIQDGIPDNYFLAINPGELITQLDAVLNDILTRTSSGSAAAVISNTSAGDGAIYQALYSPQISDDDRNTITWVGLLHGIFIDDSGRLREDTFQDGMLTDSDNVIEYEYDESSDETFVQRYFVNADGSTGSANGGPIEIVDIGSIWNARDELSKVINLIDQRDYTKDLASEKRYIFTSIGGEVTEFVDENFSDTSTTGKKKNKKDRNSSYRYLDYGEDEENLENLVNFIRGEEGLSGFRSRSLDFDADRAGLESWVLGDIVQSSPVVVASPNESYDTLYGDVDYEKFVSLYKNRRHVVYVGANDGMLHAFNAGFYDVASKGFELTGDNSELSHPLGSELWAYIPEAALPHLKWLAEPDYPHVYYVDGEVQSFDVNIFEGEDENIYPGGWGTILVASMGFGGGDYSIDTDGDGTGDDVLRSSYMIFDITDPEEAPILIAEVSDDQIGYTKSRPTIVKERAIDAEGKASANQWFLVFGSGPRGDNALEEGLSDSGGKIFAFDLLSKSLNTFSTEFSDDAFVGGVASVDWNLDYKDDVIYYGTVGGNASDPDGNLERGELNFSSSSVDIEVSVLVEPNQKLAFSATPTTYTDRSGDYWVFTGSGRFLSQADNFSNDQQYMFGIKETKGTAAAVDSSSVSLDDLVNTSGVNVFSDGSLTNTNDADNVSTYDELVSLVASKQGWYFELPAPPNIAPEPVRMRVTTKAAIAGQSLVITAYEPTGLLCSAEGLGYIFAPSLFIGVTSEFAPLGLDEDTANEEGTALVTLYESTGVGVPSAPTIHTDSESNDRAISQTTTGEIVVTEIVGVATKGGRQSWQEIPITW